MTSASPPAPPALPGLVRPILVGIVVVVGIYAVLALAADGTAVLAAARAVPAGAVGAALLASTGNFVLRGARWVLYLRRLGVRVPLLDAVLVFLAGFSMSLTPGKVGELLKPALLHDRHGTSVAAVSSAVIAERITDLLGVAALLGLGAFAAPRLALAAGLVWLGVLAGLGVLASPRLAGWVTRRAAAWLPAGARIAALLEGLLDSLRDLSRPATMVPAMLLSIGAWGLQCASLYLVVAPLALQISPLEAVLAYVAPLLAGALALVPGGVGVAEASMAGLLVQLGGDAGGGGGFTEAAAATAIVRGVTLWWAVILGVSAVLVWTLRPHRR